jgi:hypothetical protein
LDKSLLLGFMKELDKDHDGYINIEEFKAAAVGSKDNYTTARMVKNAAAAFNNGMPLPPMPLDGKDKKVANIPPPPILLLSRSRLRKSQSSAWFLGTAQGL